jgi:hypothetical protein
LLPSIATLASLNSSRRRHSTTNSRQTLRMASPLKVKFNDFEIITRSRSVPVAVSSRDDLERLSVALLQAEMPPQKPVRLLGVSLSSLQADDEEVLMKNAREHLPGGLPISSWRLACDSASSSALVLYKRSTRPFNYGMNTSLLSRIEALSLLCASSDGRNRLSANLGYFDPRWTSSVASECPGSKHKRRNPMTLYSHDITQQRRS